MKEQTVSSREFIRVAMKVKRLHDRWIELRTYGTGKPTPEQVKEAKTAFQKAEGEFYCLPDKLTNARRRKARKVAP